jgi:L-ascorbate metabolism protein UlaG (beta-lactamase superfamily)
MQVTKYPYSWVRLEQDGRVLVIDPGTWTEADAVAGVGAVLITHEHSDHLDPEKLAGPGVEVFGPVGADMSGLDCTR